jgi:hypothetical protein
MPEYSPVLGLLTGGLEILAAIYVLAGAGRKSVLRPVATILFFLAAYQFAEVAVCAHPSALILSRLAYLIIAWLPPLALWLAAVVATRGGKALRAVALGYFAAAAALSVWILADPGLISRSVCDLVLARYFPSDPFDVIYAVFYQTGLLAIVFGAGAAMASAGDAIARKHLANLQMGVLGFMFPAMAVRLLVAGRGDMLPSVMCHFAVILAASLVVLVVRERRRTSVT